MKTIPMIVLLAAAVMFGSPVSAAEQNPFKNATDETEGGLAGEADDAPRPKLKDEVLLGMTKADCERAIRRARGGGVSPTYKPGVDVRGNTVESADYKPGVDARGNKVEAADLAGSTQLADSLPSVIQFSLDVDIFDFSNRADLQDVFGNVTSSLGKVEYDLNTGQMTINGVPLGDPQQDAVAIACMQALGRLP